MAGDAVACKHRELDNLDDILSQRLCEGMRSESAAVPASSPEGPIRLIVLEFSTHKTSNENFQKESLDGDGSKDSDNCMRGRPSFEEPEKFKADDVAHNTQGVGNRSGDRAELSEPSQ